MTCGNKLCGYCRDFSTTADNPADPVAVQEAADRAKQGIGQCKGFPDSPVQVFVPWDGQFCVLYMRAHDRDGRRERFVMRQMEKRQEGK